MPKLFLLKTLGRFRPGGFSVLFLLIASGVTRAEAAKHVVKIENMKFNPPALVVLLGDTVVWENHDIFPHSITDVDKKSKIDSGIILSGKSFSLKMKKKKLAYFCKFHPVMKGEVNLSP
jgi:plastocyanin